LVGARKYSFSPIYVGPLDYLIPIRKSSHVKRFMTPLDDLISISVHTILMITKFFYVQKCLQI